jgi:hypothetical protein
MIIAILIGLSLIPLCPVIAAIIYFFYSLT